MRHIYLCCTQTDRHFAEQLAIILRQNFKNTTIEFSDASLNTSDLFYSIQQCDIFIYLLSPVALKSTWWRAQVHEAAHLGKITQPIVVEPVTSLLPLPGKLPPIDMSQGIMPEIFLDTLYRLQSPIVLSPRKSHWRLITVSLFIVLALIAGFIFLSTNNTPTQSDLLTRPSITSSPSATIIILELTPTPHLADLASTPSQTSTIVSTATATVTPSFTATASPSPTLTPSASFTLTPILPSATPTTTSTHTLTPTQTLTPSITSTFTRTPFPTRTATIDARLINCPRAPETRLQINQWVRVTFADGVRVREAAGIDTQTITYAVVGAILRTLALPVCRDSILWWKVRLDDGTIGWVAEGEPGIYYLEVTER